MNLHQLVSGAIATVNPFTTATIQASAGSTTNPDGSRSPSYAAPVTASVQKQALTQQDIYQLEGLGIQGVHTKIYLNGNWSGIIRADQKGGDIITLADGTIWLVTAVLEQWPDWTAVAVTRQVS